LSVSLMLQTCIHL